MRILVTDGMDKGAIEKVRAMGHELVEQFYEPDELGKALRDFDVAIIRSKTKLRAKQIDRGRAQYREMYADSKWGAKETYHLCISTTEKYIKEIIPGLAAYVRCWFSE